MSESFTPDPTLPAADAAGGDASHNPWLSTNHLVALAGAMTDLTAAHSQIQLEEGRAAAESMAQVQSLAQDQAEEILNQGVLDAHQHMTDAAMSIASAVVSIAGSTIGLEGDSSSGDTAGADDGLLDTPGQDGENTGQDL